MNFYFLVEGKTEKIVYDAWIKHVFGDLQSVEKIEEIKENHFFIFMGGGQPMTIQLIEHTLEDITNHGCIDHFFICLDAEQESVEKKRKQVEDVLENSKKNVFPNTHIIVHNCCIETWFLGNHSFFDQDIQGKELKDYILFFDIRKDDPELMGICPDKRFEKWTRAQFHEEYLVKMLHEKCKVRYRKAKPCCVEEKSYFAGLVKRNVQTGHIPTFGELIKLWCEFGGVIEEMNSSPETC